MAMTSSETFNPRLRLDLSSGQASLRSLQQSSGRFGGRSLGPLPATSTAVADDLAALPPAVDYEKAISLMRGRHTRDMHDRHIGSLRKIAAVNARGFFLHDVASGRELLQLAAERLDAGRDEYEEAVCELLGALAAPFQKSRSNDDLRYEEDVLGLVTATAHLGLRGSARVAAAALEMLLSLAVPPPPPASSAEALAREAVTLGPRIESLKVLALVVKSGAVPHLLGSVARAIEHERPSTGHSARSGSHLGPSPAWERPMLAALRLLRALSRSADGAAAVLGSPDLPALLSRLALPLGAPMLTLVVETVWNLIEAAPEAAAKQLLTDDATVANLVQLHLRTLAPGISEADRELRNEVLIIATLLAQSGDASGRRALVSQGMYDAALELLCFDAARLTAPTEVNLELLMLGMQFLVVMSKDNDALPHPSTLGLLVDALLKCLAPPADPPRLVESQQRNSRRRVAPPIASPLWSVAQRAEMQKRALKLMTNLAVACPPALTSEEPAAALSGLLAYYLGGETPTELRDACIRLLVCALPACADADFATAVGESGALGHLIELISEVAFCGNPRSLAPFSTQCVSTTAGLRVPSGLAATPLRDAALSLALLCHDHVDNQERFGEAGGVACLLPLLRPHTDAGLVHVAIECLWSAVVPSAANASKLVQRDGVLLLLDLLEDAPFGPRAHVLSCLADLIASHPGALEQCKEWHGSARQSAAQLCLALWSEETARRTTATGSGLLGSSQRPLSSTAPNEQYADLNASLVIADEGGGGAAGGGVAAAGLKVTTAAKLAVSGRLDGLAAATGASSAATAALEGVDMRAKLFSVLAALDFESGVSYTAEQRLLLVAAKEYIPFATAEAWRDVADEMAAEEMVPLEDDQRKLDARLAADEAAASRVIEAQYDIADAIGAADADADAVELKRVRVLRDGPMGQVQKASRGTSLFRARIEAKAKISGMVAASRVGYVGPKPTFAEYADATVSAATEAMLEAGADPSLHGFTLRHVPQALSTLATSAGIDPSHINPFLEDSGVGLTATGKRVASPAKLKVEHLPGGGVALDCVPLDKERSRRVEPEELRRLCVLFQESVATRQQRHAQ